MTRIWPRLSSRLAQRFGVFDVHIERYRSPRTEEPFEAVVLECCDWANVVALTPYDEVVLIRQFRFGTGELTLEIPGGLVDPGESPMEAAGRELREETGYQAERLISLGSVAPNPAIQRNRLHCFLAEGCVRAGAPQPDPGEDIEVVLAKRTEIPGMLARSEIDHALVAVAFQRLDLLRAGHALR